jgi:enoyl-CoA hydratase
MWAHRLGDQRAKRLLFTGDCISGAQAADWGLAVESAPADELDAVTERLLEKIAMMPINQLMMVKLALGSALQTQGVQNSALISTVFDGVARHSREGYAFQLRAMTAGFREAVRERDEPFGDHKRAQFEPPPS